MLTGEAAMTGSSRSLRRTSTVTAMVLGASLLIVLLCTAQTREVRYDLAVLKEYLGHEPVRQLMATLDHRWVRSQLSVLGGYDTSRTGETVAEVGGSAT